MTNTEIAIPGQRLGSTSDYTAGPGTHEFETDIYASIAGSLQSIVSSLTGSTNTTRGGTSSKPMLTILSRRSAMTTAGATTSSTNPTAAPLPAVSPIVVGSTVLCTVTRVQVRQAVCLILSMIQPASDHDDHSPSTSDAPLSAVPTFPPSETLNFQALLRREDVRLTEKDRVVMNESFRVGDLIRAQVISIGDERQYYVSTAGNEFGVIAAKATAGDDGVHEGGWMTRVSWKEMRDLRNPGEKGELRKVAKPV